MTSQAPPGQVLNSQLPPPPPGPPPAAAKWGPCGPPGRAAGASSTTPSALPLVQVQGQTPQMLQAQTLIGFSSAMLAAPAAGSAGDLLPPQPTAGASQASAGQQAPSAASGGSGSSPLPVIPPVGAWAEVQAQLQARRAQLQAQKGRGSNTSPAAKRSLPEVDCSALAGTGTSSRGSDTVLSIQAIIAPGSAAGDGDAGGGGSGPSRAAGVCAPGAVRPRGGVRRGSLGSFLRHLRASEGSAGSTGGAEATWVEASAGDVQRVNEVV